MSEYVTLEDAAKARGESPDTIAWLMTTKDCKIYLRFDESQESSIAISTYEGLPNHHSLYVIERGCYPLALEAQNELYQRLVEGNFDIDHLDFTDEKKKIRAFLVRGNLNVSVVVKKDDLKRLSPPSTYQTAPGSMYPAPPGKKNFENSEEETTSGKRKPHTFYIATVKKDGTKRGDAWNKLKRLASDSKGGKQIDLPGFGKIYLKRDRENPETVLRYKHTEFERPDDGNQITKGAFDRAWDKT